MNDREQHLKQVEELIKTFADPCEGIIYHYTTGEGFLGIVESGELWLTNTEFVNDISECNALHQERNLFGEDELAFNRYVEKWWERFSKDKNERNDDYYIASFSKEPASLEQWRAYGNVCIGFRAERLKKSGFFLHECVYSKEEIKSWLLKRAKAKKWMLEEPDRTISYVRDGVATTRYEDGRDGAAFSLIFNASIKLKHSCYRNEKEVRLLAVSHHDWRFRNSSFMYEKDPPIYFRSHPGFGLAVPYVKFFLTTPPEGGEYDFSENHRGKTELQVKQEKREKEKEQKRELLPIQEIWVGPTPHKEGTRVSCEILLHEKGYKDVQINVPEIPYRGF